MPFQLTITRLIRVKYQNQTANFSWFLPLKQRGQCEISALYARSSSWGCMISMFAVCINKAFCSKQLQLFWNTFNIFQGRVLDIASVCGWLLTCHGMPPNISSRAKSIYSPQLTPCRCPFHPPPSTCAVSTMDVTASFVNANGTAKTCQIIR